MMRLLPDVADVQKHGCYVVSSYAYGNHVGKHKLFYAGGLHPPMRAIRRFPDDKTVQLACAHAVGSQSLFSQEITDTAGNYGAVEMMVDIMRRWPEDPDMQIGGVHGCFMDLSYVNRARWAQGGGMELNLAAVRNHRWHAGVQFASWCAFSSGTQSPNEKRFADLGGIEQAVQVMHDHPTSYRVREEVMQSTRALGRKDAYLRERLAEAGWIEVVAAAMRDAPLDMHQQSPACDNLKLLASANETHRDRAIAAGAVPLALDALRNFPRMYSPVQWEYDGQYTVFSDCLRLLVALVTSATAKVVLREAKASADILKVMQEKPLDTEIQWLGRQLLDASEGSA